MSTTPSLWHHFEVARAAHPDRPAVRDPSGETLTYAELGDLAERVAGFLRARGIGRGARVGLVAPKSAIGVAVLLGTMRAGAAYVPADHTAPEHRNRSIMTDCAVSALFVDPSNVALAEAVAAGGATVVWLPSRPERGARSEDVDWGSVSRHLPLDDPPTTKSDDVAYILYTSGSTGVPKGVTLTQENATSFVEWCSSAFSLTPEDRVGNHAPFHFDLSVFDLYVALKHGACVVIVSEALGKSPRDLAAFIASQRLTVWYSTPSTLTALLRFGALEHHDAGSLRLVLFAGEVFPPRPLREIVTRWSHAEFYNLYGPTETNVCTFARIPAQVPEDREVPYPIGQLCSHCDGIVLDEPAGVAVPFGAEGLLHIAGASLFVGYWNRPEAAGFFERDGRRWYNTGDVVRETREEGYIYLGRRDRMVKRRGFRVELGEIERGLHAHPGIREAAAIATVDAQGAPRIVAFVVAGGERLTIVDLKTHCGRQLPSYMSPDVFKVVDALPLTSTNKIDYQALMALAERADGAA
jgi:amino acid adenylation domain-containing protein